MNFSKYYITNTCNLLFWTPRSMCRFRNHLQLYQQWSYFPNLYLVLRNKCSKTMGKMMELQKQLQMRGQGSMSGFGDSNIIHTDKLMYNLIGKMFPPPPSDQPRITTQRQNNFEYSDHQSLSWRESKINQKPKTKFFFHLKLKTTKTWLIAVR